MAHPYQVWLRQSCYQYLGKLKKAERETLIAWLESLGIDTTRSGDLTARGEEGRSWQVAVLGRHAVVWWVDDAASEIKVVAIRPADR